MTLFKTIIAAARALNALYDRSVFSYRGMSLRNRLNQECASSTTHRRGLNDGSRSISFFSSPLGRMCGMKPFSFATASFPTYAASRQRFWVSFSSLGFTTRPLSSGSSALLSCSFAAVTTSDKGTPFSSTRIFRLVPFFSPVRRVRPDRLLRQRRFDHRAVCGLPEPTNACQFIVFRQTYAAKGPETPRPSPTLETCGERLPTPSPRTFLGAARSK